MTHKFKSAIEEINQKSGTLNPIEICKGMGIVLLFTDLPKQTRGFYMSTSFGSAIVVNEALKGAEKTACIAHELGHATLHEGLNYMFMNSSTQMVTGKYENAANQFAAMLLMQNMVCDFPDTVVKLADMLSLPVSAVKWAVEQL